MTSKVLNMIVDDSYRGFHFETGRFNIYEGENRKYYYLDTASCRYSVDYDTLLDIVRAIDYIQYGVAA